MEKPHFSAMFQQRLKTVNISQRTEAISSPKKENRSNFFPKKIK
jgi:hypothetical protein